MISRSARGDTVLSTPVLIVSKFLGCLVEEKTKYKDFACFYDNTNSEIGKENTSYKTCSFYKSLHYSYETKN
jgi:hypothetical protein